MLVAMLVNNGRMLTEIRRTREIQEPELLNKKTTSNVIIHVGEREKNYIGEIHIQSFNSLERDQNPPLLRTSLFIFAINNVER